MNTEFRTWNEDGECLYTGPSYDKAYAVMREAVGDLIAEEDLETGVTHAIEVLEDGMYVTPEDWQSRHPDKPLDLSEEAG